MKLVLFLILTLSAYGNVVDNQETLILGGSINKENDVDDNSEYVRGVLSFFNSIIDSNATLVPRATFYDNGIKSNRDLSNTQRLIYSDKAQILFGYCNRDSLEAVFNLIKDKEVSFKCPLMSLNEDDMEKYKIESLRPTIEEDINNIASFINESKDKKIAIVYEKSKEWQKNYIISKIDQEKTVVFFEYTKDPININRSLLNSKNFQPDSIVILGDKSGVVNFCKKSSFTSLKKVKFILPFYLFGSELKRDLQKYNLNIYIGKIFHNLSSESELVQDYIKYNKKYENKYRNEYENEFLYGDSGFEGYVTASIIYNSYVDKKPINAYKIKDIISYRIDNLYN